MLLATPGSPFAPFRSAFRPVPVGSTGAQPPAAALGLGATLVAAAGGLVAPPPPELDGVAVVQAAPTDIVTMTTARCRSGCWPIHRLGWSMLLPPIRVRRWPGVPTLAWAALVPQSIVEAENRLGRRTASRVRLRKSSAPQSIGNLPRAGALRRVERASRRPVSGRRCRRRRGARSRSPRVARTAAAP